MSNQTPIRELSKPKLVELAKQYLKSGKGKEKFTSKDRAAFQQQVFSKVR